MILQVKDRQVILESKEDDEEEGIMITHKKLIEILNKMEGITKKDWEVIKKLVDDEFDVATNRIEFTSSNIGEIHVKLNREAEITLKPE